MMFLHGTRTSSKNTSAVSDDLIPSLSILRAMWTPMFRKNKELKLFKQESNFLFPALTGKLRPTWQLHGQAKEGFVPVRGAVAGVGQETHPVSLGAVGGPHLAPVDYVVIPVLHRLGGDTWVRERDLKAQALLCALKNDGSQRQKTDTLETSDPAPTSLTPRQATMSPAMEGRRNCCFSSSEPNLQPQSTKHLQRTAGSRMGSVAGWF